MYLLLLLLWALILLFNFSWTLLEVFDGIVIGLFFFFALKSAHPYSDLPQTSSFIFWYIAAAFYIYIPSMFMYDLLQENYSAEL